jgi:hypothetical protein
MKFQDIKIGDVIEYNGHLHDDLCVFIIKEISHIYKERYIIFADSITTFPDGLLRIQNNSTESNDLNKYSLIDNNDKERIIKRIFLTTYVEDERRPER